MLTCRAHRAARALLPSPRIRPTTLRVSALSTATYLCIRTRTGTRQLSTTSRLNGNNEEREVFDPTAVERVQDEVDVCIVGAGPAGLSAAIRLKQLEREKGREIRVVVLEKGAEVGSHILSGAVIEPRALDELLPSWRTTYPDHPLTRPATSSRMRFLTPSRSFPMPHPPQMDNTGNFIVSLSRFTAWLGTIADEMGVEVYPGFAGAELVQGTDENGKKVVRGVRTNEVGLDRQGRMKGSFEPGMEFRAKVTLLAEGAHGSLTKQAVRTFDLRGADSGGGEGADPQTYGIGLKEVWRVDPSQYRPGEVVHTMGWPLDYKTYGGGWVYHMDDGLVSLGLVIGLDYKNPWLSPYNELQRMKHHPYFRTLLSGDSSRIAYGARTLNEGGFQSIPRTHFPGGALLGCAAGFVNVPKIKGTHNAMKSGMLAAEAAFDTIAASPATDSDAEVEAETEDGAGDATLHGTPAADMSAYTASLQSSWVYKELNEVRNLRPSFNTALGLWGGLAYSGLDAFVLKGRVPWTFRNRTGKNDAAHTGQEGESGVEKMQYPPFEPPLSTDLLTSLALTGTNHAEDQPVHLRVVGGLQSPKAGSDIEGSAGGPSPTAPEHTETLSARSTHVRVNTSSYAGLLGRACPAGVYEYVNCEEGDVAGTEEGGGWGGHKLVINSQNCIHCKLCDIKVPTQDINWTVPEGGGGPKYNVT